MVSFWMSIGRSIWTGPGRPERMIWKAWRNTHGIWAASMTVTDHLVTGLVMAAMSTAWKYSRCSSARGAWPVMQRIGMLSACAE